MVHKYNDPGCRRRSRLNLSGILPRSTVNGPGIRTVVWVQGCPIRCSGCFNKTSWSFSPVNTVSVKELAARILATDGIDGVTFSGGEPFAQAGALASLGDRIKEAGLSLVTYTGYTPEQLMKRRRPAWDHLLRITDLLIAGPYIAHLACTDTCRGSSNQQVIPLSGTILPENGTPEKSEKPENGVEFTIGADGSIITSGFPNQPFVKRLARRCGG